jgi:hypothetical protein
MITAQWRCTSCNSYFEAIREDFDDGPSAAGPDPLAAPSSEEK